jgi:hypothetical protein
MHELPGRQLNLRGYYRIQVASQRLFRLLVGRFPVNGGTAYHTISRGYALGQDPMHGIPELLEAVGLERGPFAKSQLLEAM